MAGGFMATEKVGWTTFTADAFVQACTRSTGDVAKWVYERNAQGGKSGHISDGPMVAYMFKEMCECGRDGFSAKTGSENMSAAGEWFGLSIKARFARYASKEPQNAIGDEVMRFLAENKALTGDPEHWGEITKEVSKMCRL
jgi:hypothetical protein